MAEAAIVTPTFPFLVCLRDKALLFDGDRRGFLMYGVQGRTWVALGDPVGPPDCIPRLIRIFLERCRNFGGTPVFYRVQKENLHHYADFGLAVVKLGEEARVDLTAFTLAGRDGTKARHFRGLRAYKDKFSPDWDPNYLAYPGGLRLPRILADVSALVAGGYRQIMFKPTVSRGKPPAERWAAAIQPVHR
jgi:lysylphosphatidylglycerol synthetase-like protein (DUF2156 family)